jgi:lipoate-protein ligase A
MKGEGGRRKEEGGRQKGPFDAIENDSLTAATRSPTGATGGESADAPASSPLRHPFILHPSSFILFVDPPAAGAWNMAVDEVLLEAAAAEGRSALRFYRWQQPTLSLGYFQTYADRWRHEASSRAAVVRRESGGGAILHDAELTYSIAVPSRHRLAIDRLGLYRVVHTALIEALAQWGIEARMFTPESTGKKAEGGGRKAEKAAEWRMTSRRGAACRKSPVDSVPILHSSSFIRHPSSPPSALRPPPSLSRLPFLCFQRRSPGDVLVGETKVAGSAQRRCRGAILQHGSVLLARSPAAPELDGLAELVDKTIAPEQLVEAWLARLAEKLPGSWQNGRLSEPEQGRAAQLAAEKYASARWTEHRKRPQDL